MPTYDYVCRSCHHEFEEFQSMKADVLTKCPSCGKNALERKIGIGAGIIFKGGGFYETDYRSDSYKKSAEADNKPAKEGESAKTGAGESDAAASAAAGHVHSGMCGCGKKPADQCGSSSAASTPAESKPTRASISAAKATPASKPRKPAAAAPAKPKKR